MNYNFDNEKKIDVKKILRELAVWIISIVLVILLAYLITRFMVEKTTVVGNSMSTTLSEADKIVVNKFAYRFTGPKRFDIIVFKQNGREHSYYNIKRVMGLPGETVQIKDGYLYINDQRLEEQFEMEPMSNPGLADEPILLDENEYFVLGDNRNSSEDSRFANIGYVLEDDIVGKAWLRLEPFGFVGKLEPTKMNEEEEVE